MKEFDTLRDMPNLPERMWQLISNIEKYADAHTAHSYPFSNGSHACYIASIVIISEAFHAAEECDCNISIGNDILIKIGHCDPKTELKPYKYIYAEITNSENIKTNAISIDAIDGALTNCVVSYLRYGIATNETNEHALYNMATLFIANAINYARDNKINDIIDFGGELTIKFHEGNPICYVNRKYKFYHRMKAEAAEAKGFQKKQ